MRLLTILAILLSSTIAYAQQASSPKDLLLGFVKNHATSAGASAICRPELYTEIRLCTILVVLNWEALGQKAPNDPDISSIIEKTWNDASGESRNLQAGANAPVTCEGVIDFISKDKSFWQTCSAAKAIQDKIKYEKP